MTDSPQFIATRGPMLQVLDKLRKVERLDTTVLLQGESGTGKDLAAQYLHERHPVRRGGPLVSVHCGAIPQTLLESELFGHVRGAFTGAERDRVGRFEQAHGGTLFLDEISTMNGEAQIRLLRVLQEHRITRLGGNESREVDVRVVVATNQDLGELVAGGKFRLDLYYRISTFPILLPPLRERLGDIPALLAVFSKQVAQKLGLAVPRSFSSEALRALASHDWPGNVRELQNAVEYASIESPEHVEIRPEDLPAPIASRQGGPAILATPVLVTEEGVSFRTAVTNLERELILQSLRLAEGNKARAAELLDLKRTTFLEKLRRLEEDGLLGALEPVVPGGARAYGAIDALNKAKRDGLTRHIGVCNHTVALLDEAWKVTKEPLVTNQIEVHPFLDQTKVMEASRRHGMSITAYCPIARGRVPGNPVLERIGAAHGKTASQVSLRWLVQQGIIVIPGSGKPERQKENFEVLDFTLTAAEMNEIASLKKPDGRMVNPPQAPKWDV